MSLLGNGHSHFRTAGSQVARRAAGGTARILDEQQVLNAAHNESQLKSAQRHLYSELAPRVPMSVSDQVAGAQHTKI